MKKIVALAVVILGCFCIAQDNGADYPNAVRIMFSDGTSTQLACTQDGSCRTVRNTSTSPSVTRINLGFNAKHGYYLNVQ
ncbi:MAG: hypothetical protein ABSA78_03250 [Candidatus Sulfotelmatobacter sp.]|jgi:hypothetical protein